MRTPKRVVAPLTVALGLLAGACSDDPVPAPAKPRPPAAGPKLALAPELEAEPEVALYRYDPTDKRDPFKSFVRTGPGVGLPGTPLEQFDLTQLKVTGIVWANDGPRALIKDPAGKGYIVLVGTVMGKNKGRVVEIGDNIVMVKETYVDALNRAATKNVELRLREAQGG